MMRKCILSLCAFFLFAPFASAQFTNITASVKDPSGSPYVGCHAEADFVPAPTATTQPLINGSVFPTSVTLAQCDSFGNAAWTLVDNNQVSDGHSGAASQWRFSITSQDGKTGFFCVLTVTGATQNISAALQACAAPLPPTGGGGGNFVVKNLPCASSMTFTMAGVSPNTSNTAFFVNPLNCNVTSSVVAPPTGGVLQQGAIAQFTFVNAGGFAFAWPSNFIDQPTIQSGVNVTTNASFWYDGTNWHAQTFPAAGGGGGNPVGTQGTIQSTNGTTFSASNLSEPPSGTLAGALKVNEDLGACGPNPYIDIRCFGARASNPFTTPVTVGLTANCTATQTTCTISSASTFVNGDGVIIYGAGAPHSMTTPSAPTITPSLSVNGTGTLINTPSASGSTTSAYKIIARNRNGGLTAASPAGTTITAQATLGAVTVNVTSATRSGQTMTFTSAAHPLLVGCGIGTCGEVFLGAGNGLTDASFYGWYPVSSATDSTHFTVLGSPSTTLGATTSSTGGTATFYASNVVSWTAVTGAIEYFIYCDRTNSGTFTLCGVSDPDVTSSNPSDLAWEDFGATMMGNFAFPAFVPTSPPVSATSNSLSTTIVSGGGTTTPTFANAAGTTVSGATIRLDSTPALLAAATAVNSTIGGTLYIPETAPVGGTSTVFPVNSWLTLNGPFAIGQAGALYLNDTVEVVSSGNGGMKWIGDVLPQRGSTSIGSWSGGPSISVNTAHPGIWFSGSQNALHVSHLSLNGVPVNGSKLMMSMGGFNQTFDWLDFTSGSGLSDYMSMGLMLRGAGVGAGPGNVTLDYVAFAPGGGVDGASHTPTLFVPSITGNIFIPHSFSVHRGMIINVGAGLQLGVNGVAYINGGGTPLLTVGNPLEPGHGNIGGIVFGSVVLDTVSHPCLSIIGTGLQPAANFLNGLCSPSGIGSIGTSPPVTGFLNSLQGAFSPATLNSSGSTFSFASDGLLFPAAAQNPYAITQYNQALKIGKNYPVFIDGGTMAAPTDSVSAGGTIAVNSYTFQIAPIWQNGGVGNLSPASATVSTTTGNQTITINWVTQSGNPKDYRIFTFGPWGGGYLNVSGLAGQTSYVWTGSAAVVGGSFPSFGVGGPSMMMPGTQGISAATFTITSGGGFANAFSFSGTANRTTTFPDASGTVAVAATSPITISAAGTVACPNCFDKSVSNNIGANFFDIGTRAGSGNPASGNIRLYADSTSGNLTCLTSAGANCIPGGGGGTPGGSTTQVQFNSAGAFAGSANFTWVSPTLTLGVNGTTTGQLALANGGASGAAATIQNNAATSAYNFNLPSGAGNSGQPLISGGGGSTAMTFGTLGFSGGGTNQTTFTANQLVTDTSGSLASLAGTTTGTNPILKLQPSLAANTALILDTAATPTGDVQDWNLNGTKTSWVDSSAFIHTPQVTFTGSGALTLNGTNGTCPSSVTGNSIICLGDSTTQMGLLSNNGGNFKPLAQFSTAGPTAHGVGLASVTAPQINFSGAGITGQAFLSGGASADGAYGALNFAGGANIVTGALPPANGGTGATSLAGANIVTVTGAITAGHCTSWNASTVVQDSGAACGGGSSPARLDQITAGTATNTINSTTFSQTWNWALTGSTTAFKFGENTAATGSNNILLQATTANTSTAVPFQTDNNGNGYQLSSSGLWKPVGTGSVAIPGTTHGVTLSEGSSAAIATTATGNAGQVLISNGTGADPTFQDPIVSQAFVNIWNAQDITATRTSSNVRNPIFSQTATLQLTFAGITGSPATCTLQFRGVDSQGNVLNNGGTVSISPANGTSSQTFTAASTLQTAAQVSAVYACVTYPTAGTLTLDFTPIPNVNVTNTVSATDNVTQFGGTNISTGTGASGAGIPRVTISNDSSLAANQSVNVNQIGGSAVSTAATGVQKVGITGNAGAAMDAAGQNVAQPANELLTGCAFNTAPTTVTSGNMTQSQCDNKGNLLVNLSTSIPAGTNVIGALSANQSINVAQVNGNTTSTAATGVQKVGVVGNAGVAVDAATGAAPPANAVFIGGLKSGATGGFVTGITACDLDFNINISTATTTLAVTGVSGRQVRICSVHMVNNAADNVAFIEGTGATCGTGTAGMAGGTTAASGYNFPANGGLTLGSGIGEVMTTATTGDSVCIVTSAATQLSGHIKYTIY